MAIELNNALFSSISKSSTVGDSDASSRKTMSEGSGLPGKTERADGANAEMRSSQQSQIVESRKQEADEKSAAEAIEDINANAKLRMRSLELSINEELNRTVIKVVDAESGEMIRQIPSEKVLQLAEKLKESDEPTDVVSGLFLDDES